MATASWIACGCPKSGYTFRATGLFTLRRSFYAPSCSLGNHSHAEPRIVVTLNGAFETHYGSNGFSLDPSLALYRAGFDEHFDTYPDITQCLTIALPPRDAAGLTGTSSYVVGSDEFLALGRHISAEMDQTDSASTLVLDELCAGLAARVLRRDPCETSTAGWISRVRAWLEAEYDAPPSLRTIADAVDRDVSYVASVFKNRYGRTIGSYVRDLRMAHALKLMGNHQIPLVEIAHRSGFADQSHFSRLFRQRFSVTPNEFRRRRAHKSNGSFTRFSAQIRRMLE
jgi:AraC family transcriptional regulator